MELKKLDIKKSSSFSARKLKCPSSAQLGSEPSQLGLARAGKIQLEPITLLHRIAKTKWLARTQISTRMFLLNLIYINSNPASTALILLSKNGCIGNSWKNSNHYHPTATSNQHGTFHILTDAIFETGASGAPSKLQKLFICSGVGQTNPH